MKRQAKKQMKKKRLASEGILRKPRSPRFSSLTTREKATRERALALLSDKRRGEGPYTKLLRKHHLDSRTAHKYLGRDLLGGTRGKPVRASKADRRVRLLLFPGSSGDVPVRIRGSRAATTLSEYFHDRDKLLRGKLSAYDFEAKWRGVRVAGHEVFADAAAIFERANARRFAGGEFVRQRGRR